MKILQNVLDKKDENGIISTCFHRLGSIGSVFFRRFFGNSKQIIAEILS